MYLGLAEWTVLALVDQHPAHGFAIAALTSRDGEIGKVWHLPRPVVYRALGRLEDAGMVTAGDEESGPGPKRIPYSATTDGHERVNRWLAQPVRHVRDLRSELLVKLALHDRRGTSSAELVQEQRERLLPMASSLAAERAASKGFDAVLLTWRESATTAALEFLDRI